MTQEDVLRDISAYIDQEVGLPEGSELSVRTRFINKAEKEWAGAYSWRELRDTLEITDTDTELPSDFKKLMTPVYDVTQDVNNQYIEIKPDERFSKSSTDRYCYIIGTTLKINPAPTAGASLIADYQKIPTGSTSLGYISPCPRGDYLSTKAIAMILEARSDNRFPLVKADANQILLQMIEEQDTPSGAQVNRVPDWVRSSGYRIGE